MPDFLTKYQAHVIGTDAGDAHLEAREDKRVRFIRRGECVRCAGAPVRGHLGETRASRAHDGDLRHRDHTIEQNQRHQKMTARETRMLPTTMSAIVGELLDFGVTPG
jgi:hypothetical protein